MGMEKMQYVNIYGNEKSPQSALEILSRLECFHPEEKVGDKVKGEVNADVYMPLAIKIDGLLQDLGVGTIIKTAKPIAKALPVEVNPTFEFEKVDKFVEAFVKQVSARSVKKAEIQKEITVYSQAKTQLTHLGGMSASVDDIYNLGFLKVRFGRLPKESYSKLSYYAEKDFAFTSYDFDGESYWGVYFTPAETAEEADRVFESLYFERIWVPEFVHGTPAEAMDKLTKKLSELNAKMRELSTISDIATMQDIENLQKMKIWAEYNSQIFEMQKYAVVLDDSFLISGYVPKKDFSKVKKALEVLNTVKVSEDDDNAPLLKTPVKLKNNWFSRPFEMFVNMYGLPSYGDIDPTTFVSITYAILFGIMFGDVGQGVLLGIIGFFIMYKKMHMDIGLILARCSVFSVFFGFMYGSVFGFENALDPLYKALGMNGKPIEVMSTEATNFILIASIVFGIVIIAIALLTGAFSKIRRGKIPEAIFNVNGFAGFVFYVAVVALAGNMLLGLNLPFVGSTAFIVVFLGLPFVMMFLAEPICNKINKVTHKEKLGEMLTNGFFEMFDAALSFASNTMSFLRVGGFVLAHAGMMSVVFTLANMSSGVAYVLILVVGNLFVMALEGLFVGIQVLRLEFYEIFSRFLDADGVAFKPLKVKNKV